MIHTQDIIQLRCTGFQWNCDGTFVIARERESERARGRKYGINFRET